MGEVTGAMGERNTAIKLFGKTICPWQEGEPPASVEEEGDVAKKETSPGFQNVKQEKEEEEEDDVKREENESSIDNSLENCQKSAKTLPCPRCSSKDTKFCYYNNYSIKQPRYFCKNCLRYWTSGGVMRNLPVGAGRRKNKPPSCTTAIPNDSHHPLKSNETVLSFESPPLKRGKEDRDHQFSGVNGTPCPYPFNFPVHFYPATTYWNIPCLSPPLTSCTSSCSELNSTKLGKHSRNGEKLIYQSTADSLKVMYANPVPLSLSLSLKFQESS